MCKAFYLRHEKAAFERMDTSQAVQDIQAGRDRLRDGYWLLVFPEGRPNPDGKLRPFKKGAFHVAIEAGAPVIPVAVDERATVRVSAGAGTGPPSG
ncbi:MAG: hypothetical protein A2Y95_08230 [Deltaproteobacteria bacterium RBG_13_65_10]|jgi:1-acyl-sn-glycerol-3-phosphate acyltransferase|nr:MAG: hypothetical protein A2Y95_08230 [Deltaproteobacteria bacterium RBG_13_65_10]